MKDIDNDLIMLTRVPVETANTLASKYGENYEVHKLESKSKVKEATSVVLISKSYSNPQLDVTYEIFTDYNDSILFHGKSYYGSIKIKVSESFFITLIKFPNDEKYVEKFVEKKLGSVNKENSTNILFVDTPVKLDKFIHYRGTLYYNKKQYYGRSELDTIDNERSKQL